MLLKLWKIRQGLGKKPVGIVSSGAKGKMKCSGFHLLFHFILSLIFVHIQNLSLMLNEISAKTSDGAGIIKMALFLSEALSWGVNTRN